MIRNLGFDAVWLSMRTDSRHYSEHDGDIEIETVEVGGEIVTVVTIHRDIIIQWYDEDLELVSIHIEDEKNPKFL